MAGVDVAGAPSSGDDVLLPQCVCTHAAQIDLAHVRLSPPPQLQAICLRGGQREGAPLAIGDRVYDGVSVSTRRPPLAG
jgi:hypothetical protein